MILHTCLQPISGGYLILTLAPNAFSPKFDKLTRPDNGDAVVDLSTTRIVLPLDKSMVGLEQENVMIKNFLKFLKRPYTLLKTYKSFAM